MSILEKVALSKVNAIDSYTATIENTSLQYMGHRGGMDVVYPENTIASLEVMEPFNYPLEYDVGATKDGVLVLIHDTTINRTSNGTGNIADMYYDQLKQLDFGSWKSSSFSSEKIPTLEEVFRKIGKRKLHIIDCKVGIHAAVANLVVKYKMQKNVILVCNDSYSYYDLAKAVDPTIECYINYWSWSSLTNAISDAISHNAKFISIDVANSALNSTFVNNAHVAGIKIVAWTIGTRRLRDIYLAMGVDCIVAKNPIYLDNKITRGTMTLPFTFDFNKTYFSQEWTSSSYTGLPIYNTIGSGLLQKTTQDESIIWQLYAGNKLPTQNLKISFTLTPKSLHSDPTRWAGIYLCTNDDLPLDKGSTIPEGINGYNIFFRQNGSIKIDKQVAGATTSPTLVEQSSVFTSMVVNTPITVEVGLTTTTITVKVDGGTTYTGTDSDFRGCFLGFGWSKLGAAFSNVSITAS